MKRDRSIFQNSSGRTLPALQCACFGCVRAQVHRAHSCFAVVPSSTRPARSRHLSRFCYVLPTAFRVSTFFFCLGFPSQTPLAYFIVNQETDGMKKTKKVVFYSKALSGSIILPGGGHGEAGGAAGRLDKVDLIIDGCVQGLLAARFRLLVRRVETPRRCRMSSPLARRKQS